MSTEFPFEVFRYHIYKEKRKQREKPGCVAIRNKKAQKMHDQEVKAMREEWDAKRMGREINEICDMWENMQAH